MKNWVILSISSGKGFSSGREEFQIFIENRDVYPWRNLCINSSYFSFPLVNVSTVSYRCQLKPGVLIFNTGIWFTFQPNFVLFLSNFVHFSLIIMPINSVPNFTHRGRLHLLSFISNDVLERLVNNSQNFDSDAYIT